MSGKRYIFYDNLTGEFIAEESRNRIEIMPTVERVIAMYPKLSERNRETFDVIELPFEAYAQEFATCSGYRVNPETKELEFSYHDPNAPEEPQPYQPPLSDVVNEQMDYLLEMDFRLSMVELGLT